MSNEAPNGTLPTIFHLRPEVDGISAGWFIQSRFNGEIVWLNRDGLWDHPARCQEFWETREEAVEFAYRHADGLLAPRVLEMCKARNWSLHWTARGAYLHLEASELIEAIRGKHGSSRCEAADVLIVLMSITENAGIPWMAVEQQARQRVSELMATADKPYAGEQRELTVTPQPPQPTQSRLEASDHV